jgi:protein TonB
VGGIPDGTEMAVNDAPTFINQAAKLIRRVTPIYPSVALAARIQGVVIVEATTDIYGRVREARVVSGQPLLNDAALQAVRQWVYEPYLSNGIPRPVTFTVTVTFSLSQN